MPKCPKDCKKKSCIFFRTVNIPAVVANDEETPPQRGDYCNALVVYEATGNAYFFPSDGIPTLLSTANYALLKNLPSINGVTVVGDLTLSDIGVTQLVEEEASARAASDANLQEQIDAIVASSDVVDIVGTYEELEEYDTSHLTINDVIKVISDETEGGATTYYRWTGSAWDYIGAEGPYYTTAQIDSMLDEKLDVDALNDYYDKAEVDALLADKADLSDLADKQDKLVAGANISIDQATNVISATMPSLANYYTKQETYSQNEVDSLISGVEAQIPTNTSDLNNDSGFLTSIPTASASVLGGIKVGSGLSIDQNGVLTATGASMTIDSALSTTSANPVENRVITNALNNKADVSAIPVVPTNVSAFYNDAGYVTSSVIASNYYNKTETYTQNEVDGLISGVSASIPTKTSDLTNDSGFITSASLPTKTSDLVNDGADNTSTYVEADELATVATSGSYNDLSDKPSIMSGLVEMSYGESNAWAKFIAAYQAGQIVYCRASSNSNPATGTQGRKAFMAYVNNAENPTEVEFQYVRSVSSKTASQPVDQVYVYKLTSASGGTWTVQTRNMAPKVAAGTNTAVDYSNGTYTISATAPEYFDLYGPTTLQQAYARSVIALCRVSTANNTELNSWSGGTLRFHRSNGLSGVIEINIDIENAYYTGYATNVSYLANFDLLPQNADLDTTVGWRPCTFKYNNVWYGGIEIATAIAGCEYVSFEGVGNFDVFGLDYYKKKYTSGGVTHPAEILNQDIYDTLVYNKWTHTYKTWFNPQMDLTSSVTTASGVTINNGGRVMQIGKQVTVSLEITTSAQIAAWGTLLSGLPLRNPGSAIYFTMLDIQHANTVYRAYLGVDAAIKVGGSALPAGQYNINFTYIAA